MQAEIQTKRLGLLHELLPGATRLAVLVNPNNQMTHSIVKNAQDAAASIGHQIEVLNASADGDISTVFAMLVQKQVGALLVSPDTLFDNRRVQLAQLAAQHSVPTIYPFREYAVDGGLLSYGPSFPDIARLAGVYVSRILRGENPANLPVLQPTKFDLVLNQKAATALGLRFPAKFLFTADEVIE
jgi:putative ABC transport system substrate-binding protein